MFVTIYRPTDTFCPPPRAEREAGDMVFTTVRPSVTSVRPSVCPSVCPSVRPSRPSVTSVRHVRPSRFVVGSITRERNIGFRSYLVPTCTQVTPTRQSILVTLTSFSRSQRDDQVFSRGNVVGGITRQGKFGFRSYLVPT